MSPESMVETECAIYDDQCRRALREYAASHPGGRTLVDASHVRCTQACRLWKQPRTKVFVCCRSLRVHVCGEMCALPHRDTVDNDVKVCSLTNMVVGQQTYTQTPQFDDMGRPQTHWKSTRIKRPPRACAAKASSKKRKSCSNKVSYASLTRCIAACMGPRRHRDVSVVKNGMRRSATHTFESMASCTHKAHIPRPISKELMACATELIAEVIHNHMVQTTGVHRGSLDTSVAVMLTLMSTGWAVRDYVVVPRIPFVANYLPTPMLMGSIPKVQCRAVSVGVRAYKRHAVTRDGVPITNRTMVFPPTTMRALQMIEAGLTPRTR